MIQRKICMVGTFAVGKTSLVSRFVRQIFSDRYMTTIGVRIDKKMVEVDDEQVKLLIWDIHADDSFQAFRPSYLRGASGVILVIDGTRRQTLADAELLFQRTRDHIGAVPFAVALNKHDLVGQWDVPAEAEAVWRERAVIVQRTSARTGLGVEAIFSGLSRVLVER